MKCLTISKLQTKKENENESEKLDKHANRAFVIKTKRKS